MDVKVIGYYNHINFGDEQYIETFKCILDKLHIAYTSLKFIDCDKCGDLSYNDNDVIFLGGGDILNHYFLDKIISIFKNKPNKIIAVSVGIPYNDIIYSKKLNILDYIFLRTKQNVSLLERYYDKNKIFYLPDISYFSEKKIFFFP